MRHLAMIGALLLLLAEHKDRRAQQQKKKTIVGLPVLDEHSPSSGLQFFGRIFLVLLFCTLLHFWGWTAAAENFKNDEDSLEDLIGTGWCQQFKFIEYIILGQEMNPNGRNQERSAEWHVWTLLHFTHRGRLEDPTLLINSDYLAWLPQFLRQWFLEPRRHIHDVWFQEIWFLSGKKQSIAVLFIFYF